MAGAAVNSGSRLPAPVAPDAAARPGGSDGPAGAPFAAGAGLPAMPPMIVDPAQAWQALDELLVLVEALCPRWPERAPWRGGPHMLL